MTKLLQKKEVSFAGDSKKIKKRGETRGRKKKKISKRGSHIGAMRSLDKMLIVPSFE